MLNIDKIPKKINEINYFKKCESGSILYSFSEANGTIIIVEMREFEIEKDFCVDAKCVENMKLLNPIDEISIGKELKISSPIGKFKSKLLENKLPKFDDFFDKKIEIDLEKLAIASDFVGEKNGRIVLSGVNVDSSGNINASNSFYAYRSTGKTIDNNGEKLSIIIPKEFISFVTKAISGVVEVEFNNISCRITKGDLKYISRLIYGAYPSLDGAYRLATQSNSIIFDFKEFTEKYNILKKITASKGDNILEFVNGKIISKGNVGFETEVFSKNNDVEYKFFVSQNTFDKVFAKLNGKDGKFELHFADALKPIFIFENGNNFLLMPMRGDD